MCGRFTLTSEGEDLMDYLEIDSLECDFTWGPSYNIAPSQIIPVLIFKNGLAIRNMQWGLLPNWSKERKISHRIINARAETLLEKSAYRNLVKSQRCIIIADGYYEWTQTSQGKKPYYIYAPKNSILFFAGLWDEWCNDKKQHKITCSIITTEPSKELKCIHKRMPVIIMKERMNEWIDCSHPKDKALRLLKPYNQTLDYHPVSTFVNNPKNNSHKCIESIAMEE